MSLIDVIMKGSTDRSVTIRIIDATDGLPEEGVVSGVTVGIALWYRREGGAKVAISDTNLAALTTAHTDGGLKHVDDGYYRLDLPDAAYATGANHVQVGGTVTGMVVLGGRVKLIDANLENATSLGLSRIDAAISSRMATFTLPPNFALMSIDGEGKVVLTDGMVTALVAAIEGEIADDATGQAVKQAIIDKLIENLPDLDDLTLAAIASAVWSEATRTLTSGANIALAKGVGITGLNDLSASDVRGAVGLSAANLDSQLGTISTNVSTLLGRITATLFSGITSLAQWLGAMAGKQAGDATAVPEINATGAGGGTFDPTADSQEAMRERGDAAWITGEAGGGSGAHAYTITVQDEDTNPLQNATVRVREGAENSALITDINGQVSFSLNNATYTLTITKAGYQFAAEQVVVSGPDSVTKTMTATVITPPAIPEQTTGYTNTFAGSPPALTPGIVIDFQLQAGPSTPLDGSSLSTRKVAAVSDANGLLQIALWKGAKYGAWRGETYVEFVAGTDPTYELPQSLGTP